MSVQNSSGYASAFPLPVGTTLPFAGVILPTDWLWCDDALIDPVLYPNLYQQMSPSFRVPSFNDNRYCMAGNNSTFSTPNTGATIQYNVTLTAENIPALPMTYVSSAWSASLTNPGMTNGDEKNTNDDNGSKLKWYSDPSNHASSAVTFDTLSGWETTYNGANAPIEKTTQNFTTQTLPDIAIKWIIKAR